MEVSIGIYAVIFIFFFLVIPGYIARRFYYNGEFSKQISWNNNGLTNLFSSLFVGIILCVIYITLINLVSKTPIIVDDFLNQFDRFYVLNDSFSGDKKRFNGFSKSAYDVYLPFISGICFAAALLGFFIGKIVVFFSLDTKWKFLRYSNTWHYLFTGRILKIKSSTKFSKKLPKIKYTYLDILVSEKDNETKLYSGLYANYDVSFTDINKLDKIYLYKAVRYKKIDNKVEIRDIPGDVFTIIADKILNINSTYVCYEENEETALKYLFWRKIIIPFQIVTVIIFLMVLVSLIFSLNPFNSSYYSVVLQNNFIAKFFIAFTLNMLIGLLTPFNINSKEKTIKFIGVIPFLAKILLTIIVFYITSCLLLKN
jgi:hypothetical protein